MELDFTNKRRAYLEKILMARSFTFKELHAAVGDWCENNDSSPISERTLKSDIKHLREMGVEIPEKTREYKVRNKETAYYNRLEGNPVLQREIKAILDSLKDLDNGEIFEDLERITSQLSNSHQTATNRPIIQWDSNLNYEGRQYIRTLYRHIKDREQLRVTYQPFEKDEEFKYIQPFMLKEFENRWYVIGINLEQGKRIQNLALDRIIDFEVCSMGERLISESDYQYFDNIIGVTVPEGVSITEIFIEVAKPRAKYLETKPIHRFQKVVSEKEDSATFKLKLIPNKELVAKLLSLGKDLIKVEPELVSVMVMEQRG